jgi:hypothetical protein
LDFLGFSRPSRAFFNGLREIFGGNIFASLPGRQIDARRRCWVCSAADEARPIHNLAVAIKGFLRQSEPGRSLVPTPHIMRPPLIFGKKLSGILIHPFLVMGGRPSGATPSARRGGSRTSLRAGGEAVRIDRLDERDLPCARAAFDLMDCFVAALLAMTRMGGTSLRAKRSDPSPNPRRGSYRDPSSPDGSPR